MNEKKKAEIAGKKGSQGLLMDNVDTKLTRGSVSNALPAIVVQCVCVCVCV